jgi:hypothetical protein
MKSLYEFLVKDNAKILQMIFLEKQRGNVENVIELLKEFKKNSIELYNLEKRIIREGGEVNGTTNNGRRLQTM